MDFSFLDNIKFYGRSTSFRTALATLYEKTEGKPVNIVETGCVRSDQEHDLMGDGGSTFVLAQYIKIFGGHLTTVDLDPQHIATCEKVTQAFSDVISYRIGDSVDFLDKYLEPIDFLYLDSYDTSYHDQEIIRAANEHQLKEIEASYKNLQEHSLVLSDDYPRKGKYTEDYLMNKGWIAYYRKDDQILLGQ